MIEAERSHQRQNINPGRHHRIDAKLANAKQPRHKNFCQQQQCGAGALDYESKSASSGKNVPDFGAFKKADEIHGAISARGSARVGITINQGAVPARTMENRQWRSQAGGEKIFKPGIFLVREKKKIIVGIHFLSLGDAL